MKFGDYTCSKREIRKPYLTNSLCMKLQTNQIFISRSHGQLITNRDLARTLPTTWILLNGTKVMSRGQLSTARNERINQNLQEMRGKTEATLRGPNWSPFRKVGGTV